jgi:hypothetical protein
MVVVYKSGLMDLDTMDSGEMEWQMDMVDLFMQRAMFMKVNGRKIKQTVMEFIHISMEVDMKDIGYKINNMVVELSNGLMVQSMRVSTNKV